MESDKRESPRIATNIEVRFREKSSFVRSFMLNVNKGGLFLRTDRPLPIDADVVMHVRLPDDEEVMTIEGRVVWINTKSKVFPAGMGIQFTGITAEHRDKINAFVDANRVEIQKASVL